MERNNSVYIYIKQTAIRFILDKTNEILINYVGHGSNKIHIRGLMETN